MAKSTGAAGRRRRSTQDRCIALAGKGLPDGASLEEALEAVGAAARALRDLKRRAGHEFKLVEPEVRLRSPRPGARGGPGWTVFVRVPAFVTARDVREAAVSAADRRPLARSIRLSPATPGAPSKAPGPGRDRLPGRIRTTRTAPQHRAREGLR